MNKRTLLFLLLPLSLAAQPLQSKVKFQTGDLTALKAQAAREGKLLFVHFTADWCMPCQWMEKNTFEDERLADLINRNFLPVKVDIDERAGLKAKQEYRVSALPSMLVFDSRSLVIARYEESMNASRLYLLLSRHYRELTGKAPVEPAEPVMTEAPPRPAAAISRPALLPETPAAQPATPPHPAPPTYSRPAATTQPVNTPAATTTSRPAATAPSRPTNIPAPAPANPKPNFSVQVGVYSNYENAARHKEQLEKQFQEPVNLFISDENGRQLYRILIGAFETRSAAEGFVQQLVGQNIQGFVKSLGEL